jgi:SAM-dependent methyltransferase
MNCRLCNYTLEKIISLDNMPKSAQHLPTKEELSYDNGITFNFLYCPACGVFQHDLPPVPYYRDVIRSIAYSQSMKEFRQKQFANIIEQYGLRGKKALEIGAGRGEYMELLKEAGLDIYGIENNEENVCACEKEDFNIIKGFLGDGSFKGCIKNGPFGFFCSFNYFEHLPKLKQSISEIIENLTIDAYGLIEVPNSNLIIEDGLINELIVDHIYYFTVDSFSNMLSSNGFDVIDCQCVWHNYIISAIIRRRKKYSFEILKKWEQQIKADLHSFLSEGSRRDIAVWGAGHQSFATLALCNTDDLKNIICIIDSALFKHGKYSPSTHLPIVSPEILTQNKIKRVLVLAGAYNDEIVKFIKGHYPDIIIGDYKIDGIKIIR